MRRPTHSELMDAFYAEAPNLIPTVEEVESLFTSNGLTATREQCVEAILFYYGSDALDGVEVAK